MDPRPHARRSRERPLAHLGKFGIFARRFGRPRAERAAHVAPADGGQGARLPAVARSVEPGQGDDDPVLAGPAVDVEARAGESSGDVRDGGSHEVTKRRSGELLPPLERLDLRPNRLRQFLPEKAVHLADPERHATGDGLDVYGVAEALRRERLAQRRKRAETERLHVAKRRLALGRPERVRGDGIDRGLTSLEGHRIDVRLEPRVTRGERVRTHDLAHHGVAPPERVGLARCGDPVQRGERGRGDVAHPQRPALDGDVCAVLIGVLRAIAEPRDEPVLECLREVVGRILACGRELRRERAPRRRRLGTGARVERLHGVRATHRDERAHDRTELVLAVTTGAPRRSPDCGTAAVAALAPEGVQGVGGRRIAHLGESERRGEPDPRVTLGRLLPQHVAADVARVLRKQLDQFAAAPQVRRRLDPARDRARQTLRITGALKGRPRGRRPPPQATP